jgi:ATP/ADP translocase/HEAT repeat protein
MRFWRSLATALDVRDGEGRNTALLFVLSFLLGLTRPLISTAANAIYLSTIDASSLPYLYIGIAVIVTVEGLAVSALQRRLAFSTFLVTILAVNIAALVVVWFLLSVAHATWVPLLLAVWNAVVGVLTGLVFWGLAGRIFNVRQAKRLFGLIGSGDAAAGVIAGVSVSWLVGLIGTPNLLLVAAGGLTLFLGALLSIIRTQSGRLDAGGASDRKVARAAPKRGFLSVFAERYLVLIGALAVVGTLAYNFLDASFLVSTKAHFTNQSELAGFFGFYYAAGSVATLVSRPVAGAILNRFGLRFGLLVLPVGVTLGLVALVVVGTIGGLSGLAFWCIAATRLFFTVGGRSFNDPSTRVLYQPLPRQKRLSIQTAVETIIQPFTGGLAGAALLGFSALLLLDALHVSYAVLVVLVVWIVVAVQLSREYLPVLTAALATRRVEGATLALNSRASLELLEKGLRSASPAQVSYCLNLLEEADPERIGGYVSSLLDHPAPEVRQDALERMARLKPAAGLDEVLARARSDDSPAVRSAALQTAMALGEGEAIDAVAGYLNDPDPTVRTGALVGILRGGGIEGTLLAGEYVLRLRDSRDPTERALAARVIGDVGARGFYRPLLGLLSDPSLDVQRAAIKAAGQVRHPRLWPTVVGALAMPGLRREATVALIAGGDDALPALDAGFSDEAAPRDRRARILRIMARIRGGRAIDLLAPRLGYPDQVIRDQVLLALRACDYRAGRNGSVGGKGSRIDDAAAATAIRQAIEREAENGAWLIAATLDLGSDEAVANLARALSIELDRLRERLLTLLSFLFDPDAIRTSQQQLATGSPEKRSYALEVIDNVVPNDVKVLVLPLLDDAPLADRLRRLGARYPQTRLERTARLREIALRPLDRIAPWTVACALDAIARLHLSEQGDVVASARGSSDPLIRESAASVARALAIPEEEWPSNGWSEGQSPAGAASPTANRDTDPQSARVVT